MCVRPLADRICCRGSLQLWVKLDWEAIMSSEAKVSCNRLTLVAFYRTQSAAEGCFRCQAKFGVQCCRLGAVASVPWGVEQQIARLHRYSLSERRPLFRLRYVNHPELAAIDLHSK